MGHIIPDDLNLGRREFFVAGAATLSAVGCGSTEAVSLQTPEAKAAIPKQRGGLLKVGTPGSPLGLDPAIMTNSEAYILNMNTHDNLVYLNSQLQWEPQLAESWSSNKNASVWTFKLRQRVKFHHGKELTADDVVFTYQRLLNPETKAVIGSVLAHIADVQAVDHHTVRFLLKGPHATFPALTTIRQASIVASDRSPEQLESEPSGTGPFKMGEFPTNKRTVILRNPDYWQKNLPFLNEVHFIVMPNQSAQAAAIVDGSIHMMFTASLNVVRQLQSNTSAIVRVKEGGAFTNLVTHTQMEPFKDNRVRKAFKLIADRSAIRREVFMGLGSLGNDEPIAPIMPEHDDSLPQRRQDLPTVRKLLNEADFDFSQEVVLHSIADRQDHHLLGIVYQQQAKVAGIRLKIERHKENYYWSNVWMKVPFCIVNWAWRPNIDELCSTMLHSKARWNDSFYKSLEVDQLIAQGRAEREFLKRKAIYGRIQEIVSNEYGLIIPLHWPNINVLHKRVQGHTMHPISWLDLRAISLTQ